jgi:hypothetical protein
MFTLLKNVLLIHRKIYNSKKINFKSVSQLYNIYIKYILCPLHFYKQCILSQGIFFLKFSSVLTFYMPVFYTFKFVMQKDQMKI